MFHRTGRVDDEPRRHRARVTTPAQDRQIVAATEQNRFNTATATCTARRTNGIHGRHISRQTILRLLRDQGIRARRPFRELILTPRHRFQWERWARQHLGMTRAGWAYVLFTDDSRFNLFHNDGRMRVYRRRGELLYDDCVFQKDHFGGGSVIAWGGVSLNTKTDLVIVPGNLNATRYQQDILLPVAIPHLRANGRGMILMQDGAPAHTARATQALLQQQNIRPTTMAFKVTGL